MGTYNLFDPPSRSKGSETPRWPLKKGIRLGLAIGFLLLFAMPPLLGTPIAPQLILIRAPKQLLRDCGLDRSLVAMEYVYGTFKFKFEYGDWADPTKPLRPADCPKDPPTTIYLGSTSYQNPARSGGDQGCRYTFVNLTHPDFSSDTMADEFGHHRFGDAGLPKWMVVLNALYDCRNWIIFKYAEPGSTARVKPLTSDSH